MTSINVYDLIILYNHYKGKENLTEEDKTRLAKLEDHLGHIVDGISNTRYVPEPC